ncbi:MAG: immunity 53 family protein [Terrimonas ferruginea]|uniref:immunity 53 family protein n=1 Tax=Terrimonas ferruginea TaxID=249 RepID=UPI000928F004|nr:immunity 53 family protein [Terrimonas ferruginea]MBN8785431.1 immunity 53 family protein [Terrimonas ferruginea]OJW45480.1 MAG: hypothetical protein BGO56_02015 [Sphingobacteriales bacterium 48-107]
MLEWLQQWYLNNCDGYWEHNNGVTIDTLDNPGWSIEINLANTQLEGTEIVYTLHEIAEDNWFAYSVSNNVFKGAGDPLKLLKLIEVFKDLYDSKLEG